MGVAWRYLQPRVHLLGRWLPETEPRVMVVLVIIIVVVVIDRSRVHVHMPISYRASKGTPIAPQHTGNNGCKMQELGLDGQVGWGVG